MPLSLSCKAFTDIFTLTSSLDRDILQTESNDLTEGGEKERKNIRAQFSRFFFLFLSYRKGEGKNKELAQRQTRQKTDKPIMQRINCIFALFFFKDILGEF